jgi:hypothetical protein
MMKRLYRATPNQANWFCQSARFEIAENHAYLHLTGIWRRKMRPKVKKTALDAKKSKIFT